MQIAIAIVVLLLGTVLAAWYPLYLTQPKLQYTGSGGGPTEAGHLLTHVNIVNQPGLFGIRLDEPTLFGKRLVRLFEKGLTVDRHPASECQAVIYDKENVNFSAPLYWRTTDSNIRWQTNLTIRSGERVDLMLFVFSDNEPMKFFFFAPENASDFSPRIPSEENKLDGPHKFLVEISYSYGRRKLKFAATVREGVGGGLTWEAGRGRHAFLGRIKLDT